MFGFVLFFVFFFFKCTTECSCTCSESVCNQQEEYKDMDDVGALKTCGHDYHVSCIKKWLSMKNLCPVCKGSAVADNMSDK